MKVILRYEVCTEFEASLGYMGPSFIGRRGGQVDDDGASLEDEGGHMVCY